MQRLSTVFLAAAATVGLLAGAVVFLGAKPDVSVSDAAATAVSAPVSTPSGGPTGDHSRRAFQLVALAPELPPETIEASLHRSDTWVARLHTEGVDDIGAEIAHRLDAAAPTEEQARAFYTAHRDLFGGRSYAASRHAVDQLYRIRSVRASLDADAAGP